MTDHYFCVHGHFYQPPRGNPFDDDDIGVEPGAEPYSNFNEKITAECYAPNAELGNFELMSFNLGATLARWLEKHAPDTYNRIIGSVNNYRVKWGVSNALAQPAHHAVLPLCGPRDKALQVRWGLLSFEHRFGHRAEGMWLPEMAVDLETLQVLHDSGLKFTLLSQAQVRNPPPGAGPYWVKLPSGNRIAVFVRDDWQSNQVAFNVHTFGGAGRWAHNTLVPLKRDYGGRLLLLATDGETFGHHHPREEQFLHWLLTYEANSVGYEVTTLARDLRDHPPTQEVEINEFTAWSCSHGLARWSTGCECTPGDTRWKGALRRAFDNVAHLIDEAYLDGARRLDVDPWGLREQYFHVVLKQMTGEQLLQEAGLSRLSSAEARVLLALLQSQFYRQRMYVSCTFFFEDLDRPEPRYGVANAVRAALLVQQATGSDLIPNLHRDLTQALSNKTGKTGVQLLDEVLTWAEASQKGMA